MAVYFPPGSSSAGTSPRFKYTGEELIEGKYHSISSFSVTTSVTPPEVAPGNTASLSMSKWIQPWPDWNFEKIASPLYDGVCKYLGTPSNRPDFIKDYHFIGVMRTIDFYLAPSYAAFISCRTGGNTPNPPPT